MHYSALLSLSAFIIESMSNRSQTLTCRLKVRQHAKSLSMNKGDKCNCKNIWGISLQGIIGKVLGSIIGWWSVLVSDPNTGCARSH